MSNFMHALRGWGSRAAMPPATGQKALGQPVMITPPRPALARSLGVSVTADAWPLDYPAQVRAAYLRNPVAQRAVRLIAEGVAAVPLNVSGGDEAALALLNATSAGQVLRETVAAHLLLHGNAFVQVVRDASGADRAVRAPARPGDD